MKELTIDELKEIQLNILKYFAEICEQNDIRYWLEFGTLIGAVRHKGYIPWDDDVDVGMLREDFEKLSAVFNKDSSNYKFYSYDSDPTFPFAYGKIIDENTILIEPGVESSVYIDIFIFDNAPAQAAKLKKIYDKRDKYRRLDRITKGVANTGKNPLKKVFAAVVRYKYRKKPQNYFIGKISENSKTYQHIQTGYVGNFLGWKRIIAPVEILQNFILMEFEGCQFKAPAEYDKWLRLYYGDYMQLPPEDQRVSHHEFKAYLKELDQ